MQLSLPRALPHTGVGWDVAVKMIAEYLEHALQFERMAAEATDPNVPNGRACRVRRSQEAPVPLDPADPFFANGTTLFREGNSEPSCQMTC